MDQIIIAGFSLLGTLGGSYIGVLASNKLATYRIEQLEKQVDKYNCMIERLYKLEEKQALQEEQLKIANHRISDLE
jgi:TolA-binding protein